jgi:hypothetical protein
MENRLTIRAATDPRDRIFALAGLDSSRRLLSIVDYTKTHEQVLLETAKMCLRAESLEAGTWLDMLSFVHRTTGGKVLPSWVPDWRWKGSPFAPLAASYSCKQRLTQEQLVYEIDQFDVSL